MMRDLPAEKGRGGALGSWEGRGRKEGSGGWWEGGSDCARWYEKDTSKLLSVRESSLSIGASPYMGVSSVVFQ